jgi:hypothetical protein
MIETTLLIAIAAADTLLGIRVAADAVIFSLLFKTPR